MRIKTAIIDDGVNARINNKISLYGDYEIQDGKVIERKTEINSPSHGTYCASVFCNFAVDYQLYSVKVLNERRVANKNDLIIALEWCLYNNIQLINLSLGTTYYKDFENIKKIINQLYLKGIIIVAACDNRNIRTYPACLPEVIGVKADRVDILKNEEYIYIDCPYDGIDIISYSKFSIPINGEQQQLKPHNSYSAPHLTALICNYISKNSYDIQSVRSFLKRHSKNIDITYENLKRNMLDWKERIENPILAIIYKNEDMILNIKLLKELINYFQRDGYYCIACIDTKTDADSENIFYYEEYANGIYLDALTKIKILYNVESPDMLITCICEKNINILSNLHSTNDVDLILCINNKRLFYEIKKTMSIKTFLLLTEEKNFFDRLRYFSLKKSEKLYLKVKKNFTDNR